MTELEKAIGSGLVDYDKVYWMSINVLEEHDLKMGEALTVAMNRLKRTLLGKYN
jgi:hypothetical protein